MNRFGPLICALFALGLPVVNLVAQAPRRLEPSVRVLRDQDGSIDRASNPLQAPEPQSGVPVGWTLFGAVIGFIWYQAQPKPDGDMGGPIAMLIVVAGSALVGTLVGIIIE